MPRLVPVDYFYTGVWRASGPLALRHYTCTQCGVRSPTYDRFRAHRAVCPAKYWVIRELEDYEHV
jgi:hypothetical protein